LSGAAGDNRSAMVTVQVRSILLTSTKNLDCILTDIHANVREIAAELSFNIGSV